MPEYECSYPNCSFKTADLNDATLALFSLQIHAQGAHPVPSGGSQSSAPSKEEKVARPTIAAAGTAMDWTYFTTRWEEYKAAKNGLNGKRAVLQLLECCEEGLRRDLTRNAGGSLADTPETDVLKAIKILAVRQENIMVSRNTLWNMQQDHDESVRSFGARLRGQASMCDLTRECSSANCQHLNSFSDEIVRDVLIRGLSDYEIRLAILQDKNQNMSLEDAFQFIEAKEAGKRSAQKMLDAEEVAATRSRSQYHNQKKLKHPPAKHTPPPQTQNQPAAAGNAPCDYCGKSGHGANSSGKIRSTQCPAYNKTCSFCGTPHHIDSCCRKKVEAAAANDNISCNDSLFTLPFGDQLCAVTDSSAPNTEGDITQQFPQGQRKTVVNTVEQGTPAALSPPTARITETASEITPPDLLCTTTSHNPRADDNLPTLDHHIFDKKLKTWVKKPSQPQPFLNLDISIHPEDYDALRLPRMVSKRVTARLSVLADTGCQSMLISYKLLRKIGIYEKHLIPASMRMNTATCGLIDIIGCVVMRFVGTDSNGSTHETRQIVYVTNAANKLFLSKEACVDLGLISPSFPNIGDTQADSASNVSAAEQPLPCGHHKRVPAPQKLTELPFPATKENRPLLKKFLLDYYANSCCNICTHQPMPKMKTTPMRIMIDENATPRSNTKIIPVPLNLQDATKEGLDADVRMDNLEPLPEGEPITWFHQMVIAQKKNGDVRRTVDFQSLNKHAIKEKHHTQSPFHLARSIPKNTLKTTFDNWNSFHALPLHPDDWHYTTFGTPWGVYRYKVAPQGYAFTCDAYTKRFDKIVAHIQRKVQCVDDSCLWDSNVEEAFFHAVEWFDTCARHGVTINPDKFMFAEDTVEFAGFEVTTDSVRPCKKSIDAILNFPTPRNITDMRSWFGLLNQVAYAFSVAERTSPFRHLLKPDTPFIWTPELDALFEESKKVIVSEIEEGVRIYDKSKPTCLATDWSKTGVGFWLFQKHCSCESSQPQCCPTGWKIAMVGSRFTQQAESRYAPIEGEALAVTYALEKARFFVLGCDNLTIAVDHKPLLGVFSDRSLDMANDRLRNLKEKTLRYRFKMHYIPGMKNKTADSLSRHPSDGADTGHNDEISCLQVCPTPKHSWRHFLSGICSVEAVDSLDTLQAITWDNVREATNSDPSMCQLLDYVEHGFPNSTSSLTPDLQPYFRFRKDLFAVDGVVLYKDRVVIPPIHRPTILNVLHAAHQGTTSMISRAESTVFWPGITAAILHRREKCNDCNRMAPSQPSAPPMPSIDPAYPFQCVCADFFDHGGYHYSVLVDRYSNYPIVERAKGGAKGLIDSLKRTFSTFGIPDELATDGGSEFTSSSTKNFLRTWGIDHRLSSVAFPHSNCRAEIGVKTVKRMITSNTSPTGELDTDAFRVAMLQYRNTPDPDTKLSPAMCVFGRPIKDFIPVLPGRYQPHSTWQDTLNKREEALRVRHIKAEERWTEHTKRLPPLKVGDTVRLQNQVGPHPTKWDKTGLVTEVRQFDQYLVRVDGSGRVTLRNRKFLRKFVPMRPQRIPISIDTPHTPSPSPFPSLTTRSQHAQPSTPAPVQPTPPIIAQPTPTPTEPIASVDDREPQLQEHVPVDLSRSAAPATAPAEARTPPIHPTAAPKKPPLALRRLASFNTEGRKGLGEFSEHNEQ